MRTLFLAGLFAARLLSAQQPEFDVVIKGGSVIDGTGASRYSADVALKGDRIAMISRRPIDPKRGSRVIDATGRIVAPGFIDMHAHLDPLPELPGAESAVRQGVTFALGGPDGGSPLPLGPYMDAREKQGIGINVGYLVGHNTIRQRVMGMAMRAPTTDELQRMKALVAEGMGQGAFGISTGLRYLPGNFAKTDEVIELSRVAADSSGIYTSHLREEGLGLIEGVEGQQKGGGSMIYHVLDESDVQRIMRHPQAMIGSDGRLSRPGETSPHPRAYGTFPRVLGRYARDLKLFPLETAIYKMTGQSAARLKLRDRGVLRAGNFADVVVFDAATIADKATFEQPHQYPVGIDFVFINGVAAVDTGRFTDARSGRVLKRGK
jgi:N-acyl-D-aspartate/D-glutamate deacylase